MWGTGRTSRFNVMCLAHSHLGKYIVHSAGLIVWRYMQALSGLFPHTKNMGLLVILLRRVKRILVSLVQDEPQLLVVVKLFLKMYSNMYSNNTKCPQFHFQALFLSLSGVLATSILSGTPTDN